MKLYWFYEAEAKSVMWKIVSSDNCTHFITMQPLAGFKGCLKVMNALADEIEKLSGKSDVVLMNEWEEVAKKAWDGDQSSPEDNKPH